MCLIRAHARIRLGNVYLPTDNFTKRTASLKRGEGNRRLNLDGIADDLLSERLSFPLTVLAALFVKIHIH